MGVVIIIVYALSNKIKKAVISMNDSKYLFIVFPNFWAVYCTFKNFSHS